MRRYKIDNRLTLINRLSNVNMTHKGLFELVIN